LGGVKWERPITHDLFKTILESIDVKVNKVEICDLKDNTYFALIYITHMGKHFTIDARPSDALALSLRMKASIFASEEILNESTRIEIQEEKVDKWKEILEKLDPEDLGKA
jgi:bifunctional DNase/RNase